MPLTQAEALLQELGITTPNEIDLEAIAYHVNAEVRFRPLDGCEARIVGYGKRAIITVNSRSSLRRKRFSIAHELGHWRHHKGQRLFCRADDFRPRDGTSPERVADSYAADLLLPHYLFNPILRTHSRLDFKTVNSLAETFTTSQTATAIRIVSSNQFPALLVCHCRRGRKWYVRASNVPQRWYPNDALASETFAFDVLHGGKSNDSALRKICAKYWFDIPEADLFDIYEQTMRTGPDETITLLALHPRMLEDPSYADAGLKRR